MKKFLHISKSVLALVSMICIVNLASAQTRTATTDGPWNSTTTWGGQSIPTSANAVVINPGVDVTLATGANAECSSLTFASSASTTASTISVSSGFTLTVTGAITLNNAAANSRSASISGAGTVSAGSLVIGGTTTSLSNDGTTTFTSSVAQLIISGAVSINSEDDGNDDNDATFSITGGVVTVSGVVTLDSDNSSGSTALLTLQTGGQNGKLILLADSPFTLTGSGNETTSLNGTSSTVEYGGGDQTVRNTNYRNLIISGAGTKVLAGTVNGTLTLSGNNTLSGSVTYGGSAVLEYNGSVSQNTTNVEFPTNMSADLIINNANGVTLNSSKNLSGSLTLTNGVLYTSSTNLLNFPDNFSTVNGGSASSYIDGPVRKTGNNAFTFPLGKNGVYAPLSITNPDSNTDQFTAEYIRSSATALGPIAASLSGQLYAVSACEYWNLTENVDGGTANSINVTVTWSAGSGCGSGYITDYTKLTLAHFNGTEWDSYGGTPSGSNSAGSITWSGISTFSPFALGTTSFSANPLPVSFSDVKAVEKGNAVQIDWTNLTESDVESYIIERSANGVDFTAIATVAPRSNQVDRVSYSYLDMAPLSGTNFYRIKAVELDGKSIYTRNLRVDIGRNPKGISLYPNPVKGQNLTIGFSAARGIYNLQVVNNGGQVVYRQQMNHNGGTISQQLNLPASLKSGVYSLLISGDNYKESRMFVVQQ